MRYEQSISFESTIDQELENELAVIGLSAAIQAHNDGTRPFGVDGFMEPIDQPPNTTRMETPKWCNKRQNDGTWDSVIDGKDDT